MQYTLLEGATRVAALAAIRRPGKRIRAPLALLAGGLPTEDTVAWATACECLHLATLVHDDIQDGDERRSGEPSIWAEFGLETAITTGDALLLLATVGLDALTATNEVTLTLVLGAHRAALRVARGQSRDLAHDGGTLELDAYAALCRDKTGQLLALPVWGVLVMADTEREAADHAVQGFIEAGVPYQILNDLYAAWGDSPGDLDRGRPTVLAVPSVDLDRAAHLARSWIGSAAALAPEPTDPPLRALLDWLRTDLQDPTRRS